MLSLMTLSPEILAHKTDDEIAHLVDGNLKRIINSAHPSIAGVVRWLSPAHLPENLRFVALPFTILAINLVDEVADTQSPAELTTALRRILEAKDCAVRAAITWPTSIWSDDAEMPEDPQGFGPIADEED